MRIGFTTYPVAFQRPGGLEVQIRQTAAALSALGADVQIVELYSQKLSDFDIIHHFSLKHSSHRILQYAKSLGIPTVTTPLCDPLIPRLRLESINVGRSALRRLFGQTFSGYWDELAAGLALSRHVFPLTEREQQVLETFYPPVRGKCTVVPNGVAEVFFSADPSAFRRECPCDQPILLLPSSIEPRKNQLHVIRTARPLGVKIALAGPVLDAAYWRSCQEAGGDALVYLGELPADSELLISAFAAADCVALLSLHEPFGLVPFEALAAGTPAILTTKSGVDKQSAPPWFQRVDPADHRALTRALQRVLDARRNPEACRAIVTEMRWSSAAATLLAVYRGIAASISGSADRGLNFVRRDADV